jgi:hypothetical protein
LGGGDARPVHNTAQYPFQDVMAQRGMCREGRAPHPMVDIGRAEGRATVALQIYVQQKGAYPSAMAMGGLTRVSPTHNEHRQASTAAGNRSMARSPPNTVQTSRRALFDDVNVSTFGQVIRWQPSERTRACGCITPKKQPDYDKCCLVATTIHVSQ